MAYHAGVLWALEQVGGVCPDDAELVVGTSAGSVIGAYMRSGATPRELWDVANAPEGWSSEGLSDLGKRAEVWAPMFRGPIELGRRTLGSSYVMLRSILRAPSPRLPGVLQHVFPAGMFSMEEGRRRLREELPNAWPERSLWLCAIDINTGRRVVLGRPGSPAASLPEAVLASAAIPGVYRPVRIGDRTLVDGGVWSSSNLDLAGKAGLSLAIGVVPMAFDTADPPPALVQLTRRIPARALADEVVRTRACGTEVLLIRPSRAEVMLHGIDLMRPTGLARVAQAAYESAARSLESERFRAALGDIAA
jgi:NTE family protein